MPSREAELIYKPTLSSDWRLQLASMKLESLVIAGQQHSGESVPGPCTHRPSHHGELVMPEVVIPTVWRKTPKVELVDWGEVVTR